MPTLRVSAPDGSPSRRVLVVLICAIALLAAACGGGGDDGNEPAQTSQEDSDGSDDGDSEDAEEEAPEEGNEAACLEGPHDGRKIEVEAVDFAFKPNKISVEAGETVTIVFGNTGTTPHSFTLDDPACDTNPIFSDEGEVMATFVAPDEDQKFVCTVHPNMTGELAVR